jgi:hypothetical protein
MQWTMRTPLIAAQQQQQQVWPGPWAALTQLLPRALRWLGGTLEALRQLKAPQ